MAFEQKRICLECHANDNLSKLLVTRQIENWRGLIKPSKEANVKIPILKNGNFLTLKGVTIRSETYSLSNTCAFDSIFQLFLAACVDHDNLFQSINQSENIEFFKMIISNASCKFNAATYRDRTKILINIKTFSKKSLSPDCIIVDCKSTASFMFNSITENYTTIQENVQCDLCHQTKKITSCVVFLDQSLLSTNHVINFENVNLKKNRCFIKNCTGYVSKTVASCGSFIAFEPYNAMGVDVQIFLANIPHELVIKINNENKIFILIGVINFYNFDFDANKRSVNTMGHFSALYKNTRGQWVEYDDLKNEATILKNNFSATPYLILYGQA